MASPKIQSAPTRTLKSGDMKDVPKRLATGRDKGADLGRVNRREPKWSFGSRLKNFLDPARKETKIQEWQARETAAQKARESARKQLELKYNKTGISLPFDVKKTGFAEDFMSVRTAHLPTPSVQSSSENSSRVSVLRERGQALTEEMFNDLFREDSTAPNEWIVEHKRALRPIAQEMKDRMVAMLGSRDPLTLSHEELHDIAAAVWSVVIPGLHGGYCPGIPKDSKFLMVELVQAVASSPSFEKLGQADRANAIKAMFYFAYFNRGFQALFCEKSGRMEELEAIRPKQRTDAQKAELDKEAALASLMASIAQFGAAACGLVLEGKLIKIPPSKDVMASSAAFYQALSSEALSRAGVSREASSVSLAKIAQSDDDIPLGGSDSVDEGDVSIGEDKAPKSNPPNKSEATSTSTHVTPHENLSLSGSDDSVGQVIRPKAIEKNAVGAAIRGALWSAKTNVEDLKKKTAVQARETVTPLHVLVAKQRYGVPTEAEINLVKAEFEFEDYKRGKLIGLCIPDSVRGRIRSGDVEGFLQRLKSGVSGITDKDLQQDLKKALRKEAKVAVVPMFFAEGLLACAEALKAEPALFSGKVDKSLWLPVELRAAFIKSGSTNPSTFLMNLTRLREEFRANQNYKAAGKLTQSHIDGYQNLCRTLNIDQNLVEDSEIRLNKAFSYMTAWDRASGHYGFKEWVGFNGQQRQLVNSKAAKELKAAKQAVEAEREANAKAEKEQKTAASNKNAAQPSTGNPPESA